MTCRECLSIAALTLRSQDGRAGWALQLCHSKGGFAPCPSPPTPYFGGSQVLAAAIESCAPSLGSRAQPEFAECFGGTWSGPRGKGELGRRCLRSWHRQGKRLAPDFHPDTDREVLPGQRACAGSDVRERRSHLSAAALSKVRVKCDTPAKWEQKKHPSTRPSPSPPPFSMETPKRRRSRVRYGKVSPWSETVSGVSAGSELPVSGEGRRQAGRSLATYTNNFFSPAWSYFIPAARISTPPPPPSPGWSAEMRLCALIPSRALKQNPAPRSRRQLGAPRRWSAAGPGRTPRKLRSENKPPPLSWRSTWEQESPTARSLRCCCCCCCMLQFYFLFALIIFIFFFCLFVSSYFHFGTGSQLLGWTSGDQRTFYNAFFCYKQTVGA